jgi:uncharacterized protein (DUF927 family)
MRNESDGYVRLTRKGVFWVQSEKELGRTKTRIGDPICVRALGQRDDEGKTRIAQLQFKTFDGKLRREFVKRSLFLASSREELKRRLVDWGYEWPEKNKYSTDIVEELRRARPKRQFLLVQAPGWHGSAILLGNSMFGCSKSLKLYIDPATSAHVGSFELGKGTLKDWKRTVAAPSRKSSVLRLSIAAGLAAPFLRPLKLDSFGINLFSKTSGGKTSCLLAAASIAGSIGDSGLPGWADSEAGIEDQCYGHRDFLLPLDESADGEHQTALEEKARMLAFMVARNRPRTLSKAYEKRNGLRKREYRIILLSSSERALGYIAREAGRKRLGGEEVRLIDVPASDANSHGIFDGTTSKRRASEVTKKWIERIKHGAHRFQGHAIRALLGAYMQDPDGLQNLKRYMVEFEERFALPDGTNAYLRIRTDFALIYAVALLAIDYEILPWKKGATYKAIAKCLRAALAALEPVQPVTNSIVLDTGQAKMLLTKHLGGAKLVKVKPTAKVPEPEAEKRRSAEGFVIGSEVFVRPECVKRWLPNIQDRKNLRAHKLIRTERDDVDTVLKKIGGLPGRHRYYAIDAKLLKIRQDPSGCH